MNPDESDVFARRVGAELREFRQAAELSQQAISDLFEWGRDAMSKLEMGKNTISLHQYLQIMRFLRDVVPPEHPGLALADHFLGDSKRRRRQPDAEGLRPAK